MASEPLSSSVLLAANLPIGPLLRLGEGERSLSAQALDLHEALHRPLLTDTPYGILRQCLDLASEDGGRLEIELVHPMALLHLMTMNSESCGLFLKQTLSVSSL